MVMLPLNEYQKQATATSKTPLLGHPVVYSCLGLGGEAGEVLEWVKKAMRDHGGEISQEMREKIKLELGDVMWYTSDIASKLNLTLEEIAVANIEKLATRHGKVIRG